MIHLAAASLGAHALIPCHLRTFTPVLDAKPSLSPQRTHQGPRTSARGHRASGVSSTRPSPACSNSLLRARALSSRYIRPVEDANLHHSWAEALHTCSLSNTLLCHTTSHRLLPTTPKQQFPLPLPLRFRTLPRSMVCARVRSHQPAEQNGLSRSGYGEQRRCGPGSPFASHTLRAIKEDLSGIRVLD